MVVVALLLVWAAAIAWYDWRWRRVPNVALILVLVPAALALALQGKGLLGAPWLTSLGGMALGLALTLPGYLLRRYGAGDVKFAAVLGLLLGAARGLEMVLLASLLMGAAALAMVVTMGMPRQARFPAAPMLSVAFAVQALWGPLLTLWRE
ncbi:MAG: prepilin peptidase [Solimonas sp.]